MSTKLYVGGLPYKASEEEVQAHFAQAGAVTSAIIIRDKFNNNRSKGFGFVEMESEDDANKAIDMFNGKDFQGRNLTVSIARPLEPRA